MRKLALNIVPMLFAATVLAGTPGNGNGFVETEQTVEATFASEADAQAAVLAFRPLPFGKRVAWTHRSDDTNGKHVQTATILARHGFRTTCYMNGIDDRYASNAIPQLKALGCGFGNHTLSHCSLPAMTPNMMFKEVAIHQAMIEGACDQVSIAFTSPFGATGAKQSPEVQAYIGDVLRRAGIFLTAEGYSEDFAKHYGLRAGEMLGGYYMPTMWKYTVEAMDKDFPACFAKASQDANQPKMTFGMHSWQSAAQYKTLEDAVTKYADRPDIWYTTETDYGAYRYALSHANPRKTVAGTRATWTLARLRAADLGSDIPLEATFSVAPRSVKAAGAALAQDTNGVYRLPNIGHTPAAIENLAAATGTTRKVPALALAFSFDPAGNRLSLSLENRSGRPIDGGLVTFKAPPEWVGGLWSQPLRALSADGKVTLAQTLGDRDPRESSRGGDEYFLVKIDFDQGGKTYRAYAVTMRAIPRVYTACPRDCSFFLGPQKADALSAATLAEMSRPGTPLDNVGTKLHEVWANTSSSSDSPYKMEFNYHDPKLVSQVKNHDAKDLWQQGGPDCIRLIAIDFEIPADGDYCFVGTRMGVRELWLNGSRTDYDRSNQWVEKDTSFKLKKGLNRLIIVHILNGHRWQAGEDNYMFSIWRTSDKSTEGIRYVAPVLSHKVRPGGLAINGVNEKQPAVPQAQLSVAQAPAAPIPVGASLAALPVFTGLAQASGPAIRSLDDGWMATPIQNWRTKYPDFPPPEALKRIGGAGGENFSRVTVPCDMFESELGGPRQRRSANPFYQVFFKKTFALSKDDLDKKEVRLDFKCLAGNAVIWINGGRALEHVGDFTGFSLDITPWAHEGDNLIGIELTGDLGPKHSGPTFGRAKHVYGNQWWSGAIRLGILNDVSLVVSPALAVREIKVVPRLAENKVILAYTINNPDAADAKVDLAAEVVPAREGDAARYGTVRTPGVVLAPGVNRGQVAVPVAAGTPRWSPDSPALLRAGLRLEQNGKTVSAGAVRFGYREFGIDGDGDFVLNGKKTLLFGDNQNSMDFVFGRQLRTRAARDAEIIRRITVSKQMGHNIVRTAHEPICGRFLGLADELGLMVFQEWGWAFTSKLDDAVFMRNNTAELTNYVATAHNHPSVVMWSLGNEVWMNHRLVPVANAQYDIVRSLDLQARPISTQSGSAAGFLGDFACKTDLFDLHDYCGASYPWTDFPARMDQVIDHETKVYGAAAKGKPFVAWELVGFSWGFSQDPKFRPGNVDDYAAYMAKSVTWGCPNGIGFAGSIPLARALTPGADEFAESLYGKRICETLRIDGRFKGFSPWFSTCSAMPLWTQPVLPSLVRNRQIFPKNLFAGETADWDFAIANAAGRPLAAGWTLEASCGGQSAGRATGAAAAANLSVARGRFALSVPGGTSGHGVLNLVLKDGAGKVVGTNAYPVFVANRKDLMRPVAAAREVQVLDTGVPENVAATTKLLASYGLAAKKIASLDAAGRGALVVVPAEVQPQTLALGDDAVRGFLRTTGGVCLILEQRNPKSVLPLGQHAQDLPSPFVDQVSPGHPVFGGLAWSELDSWNNDLGGVVVRDYLAPYVKNALAVKGPQLGMPTKSGNAILEATCDGGRLLMSQLEVVSSYRTDPAAALYAWNLLAYAAGKDFWSDALPWPAGAVTAPARVTPSGSANDFVVPGVK